MIRGVEGAHSALLDLEEPTEDDLDRLGARSEELARLARDRLRRGEPDTDHPEGGVP